MKYPQLRFPRKSMRQIGTAKNGMRIVFSRETYLKLLKKSEEDLLFGYSKTVPKGIIGCSK